VLSLLGSGILCKKGQVAISGLASSEKAIMAREFLGLEPEACSDYTMITTGYHPFQATSLWMLLSFVKRSVRIERLI
jgi:hypothetical protein